MVDEATSHSKKNSVGKHKVPLLCQPNKKSTESSSPSESVLRRMKKKQQKSRSHILPFGNLHAKSLPTKAMEAIEGPEAPTKTSTQVSMSSMSREGGSDPSVGKLPTSAANEHASVQSMQMPRKGDQIRTANRFQEDLFAKSVSKFWSIGVVQSVKRRGSGLYTIKVTYSDGASELMEFPNEDIEIIVATTGSPNIVCALNGHFAYASNPDSLFIGDYVECFYQDGNRGDDKWWQGRIAHINKDGTSVNVAYFDNEVSSFFFPMTIPITSTFLISDNMNHSMK